MDQARKKNKFLKHFKESFGIVSYSCELTGISRNTFYKWKKNDEVFAEKVREIEEQSVDVAESKLLSQINDGNLTAIIFYLKTKGRDRGYVERREDDVTLNGFEAVMKALPDEEDG